MKAARAVFLWCLLLSLGSIRNRAQAQTKVDVKLEVTQSMQYFETMGQVDNGIPLVAGRKAGVRTKVTVSGAPAGAKVASVDDEKLTVSAVPGPPGSPIYAENAPQFTAFLKANVAGMAAFDRAKEDHTLNFEVPSVAAGTWAFEVSFKVTFSDGTAAMGAGKAQMVAFTVHPPKILCVPVNHRMVDPPDLGKIKSAIKLATSCLPLPEGDWIVIDTKERKMWRDRGCEGALDRQDPGGSLKSDVDYLLSELEERRIRYRDTGIGSYDLVMGFIPHDDAGTPEEDDDESIIGDDACKEIFGYSWPCDTRGICTTLPSVVHKTFSHELGHMLLDLPHCDEVGDCSVGSVGWDITKTGGTYVRANRTSFMISGVLGDKKPWITPDIYERLFKAFYSGTYDCTGGDVVPVADAPRGPPRKVAHAVSVRGGFSEDGKKLLWIDPVFRYPWALRPTPDRPGGRYEALVVGSSGTKVKVRFDARHQVEPKQGRAKAGAGFFSLLIPFPENERVDRLDILDAAAGDPRKRYGGFEKRAPVPPVLTITEPAANRRIEKELTISWGITGKDASERLLFQIDYSPDGGKTFLPLEVNVEDVRTLKVNVEELIRLKSEKGALIQIHVSDGLNNDSREVGGLVLP